MKVKDLIKDLQSFNPEFEVEIEVENYDIKPLVWVTGSLYTEKDGRVVLTVNDLDWKEYQDSLKK